jgi:hypothetical protein
MFKQIKDKMGIKLVLPEKRKVMFVVRMGKIPYVISVKNIDVTSQDVRYNRKLLHPIDITHPTFKRKNTFFYMVDIKSGQLSFSDSKAIFSPELFDTLVTNHLGKQLVAGLEASPFFQNIAVVLLGILCGTGIGYVIRDLIG